MLFSKRNFFLALIGLTLGAVYSFSQYWDELQDFAFPEEISQKTIPIAPRHSSASKNTTASLKQATEESKQILADTANIQQLIDLSPPAIDAPDSDWQSFLAQLNTVDTGKRYSNSGITTPLLTWYAYIAKYKPSALYKALNTRDFDTRKFNHLLQTGFLTDWSEHVLDTDRLILGSYAALSSFAQTYGKEAAQNRVINAFFNSSESSQARYKLSLGNLSFAFSAMSDEQKQNLLPDLLNSKFSIDPRGVHSLRKFPELDRKQLLALIHKHAYDSKSMSSFMYDGVLLGDASYINKLLADLETNAKQPTNFYCSFCTIALTTDGLLGDQLVKAFDNDELDITSNNEAGFVLSQRGSKK